VSRVTRLGTSRASPSGRVRPRNTRRYNFWTRGTSCGAGGRGGGGGKGGMVEFGVVCGRRSNER
jgi:hypothetical protein